MVIKRTTGEPVVVTDDIENHVCSVRNAVAIAADLVENTNGDPLRADMAMYALYHALDRSRLLYSAFYASSEKGLRVETAS